MIIKKLFFIAHIAIYSSNVLAQSTDTTAITIQATAQEICSGEQVVLSVRKTCAIGDILCTDGTTVKREEFARSNKTAKGVIFWISPDETHGWAVHLQEELYREWSTVMEDLPNLPNVNFDFNYIEERYVDTAGYQNTKIIRESGDSLIFPAAYSVNFENGWYLPAARQVVFLQARIEELNKSLTVIPRAILIKGVLMYENQTYQAWRCWSSTEIDKNSVICGSALTCMVGWKTRTDLRTRAVCRFEIDEE